jgi:uncharacterized repeat protein (TIGR03803 family)
MLSRRSWLAFSVFVLATLMMSVHPADSQTVNEVFAFSAANLGSGPEGTPVQGRDGKLYGVVNGSIFRMSPGGKNAEIVYAVNSTSGWNAASLILATDGKFYGTGFAGSGGDGILFSLTPSGTFTVLYQFNGGSGGVFPVSPLVEASDGNLYGVTDATGNNYQGTVYKYDLSTGLFSTILTFNQDGSQGNTLSGPLLQAADGNLYGVAVSGGAYDYGAIYSLTTSGTLLWEYSFGVYAVQPDGALIQASDGNIYGVTVGGGSGNDFCSFYFGCGTIFMLSNTDVSYVYSFQGYPVDGYDATAALLEGSDGKLYGTTARGGYDLDGTKDYGTLYQITTDTFQYQLLYSFVARVGWAPYWSMMQHTNGKFFGTTVAGGRYAGGAMYSLNMGLGPFIALVRYTGRIGQPVQILGQGLTGSTAVTVNGVTATSFEVVSDTYMTAVVPTGATTGPVVVTTPTGSLTSNRNFQILH